MELTPILRVKVGVDELHMNWFNKFLSTCTQKTSQAHKKFL